MRKARRELINFRGSKYALVPFFIAEEYGFENGGNVEYDKSNPEVLLIKITRKED
ncbi:MAG: hypothetical protein M1129_04245 [Candidatus Thermoplasmatota archaeon]|jgi:hypothetical protein|nr:hypothetical protein [Candidatus Thermoplasmatota archaeon]